MCTHFQVIIMQISRQQTLLHKQLFISLMLIKLSGERSILHKYTHSIAPDKAAYCVFTQFRGPENAIKFISVRTKTQ